MTADSSRLRMAISVVAETHPDAAAIIRDEARALRAQSFKYRERLRRLESSNGAASHARLLDAGNAYRAGLQGLAGHLRDIERVTGEELPQVVRTLERSILAFVAVYGAAVPADNPLPPATGGEQ